MSRYAEDVNNCLVLIQQGDSTQFDRLVEITAIHLRVVIRTYLRDKNLVEDVLSDTYLRAYNYLYTYKFDEDGYNWLCKIAENAARSVNKKEKRYVRAEDIFDTPPETEYIDTNFEIVEFLMQLETLDAIDYDIAYKRFYMDETLETISADLNVSKAAVYKRLTKIYKILYENGKIR